MIRRALGALTWMLAATATAWAAEQDPLVAHTRALASTIDAIVHAGGHAGFVVKLEPVVGLENVYPVSAVFNRPWWHVRLPPPGTPTRALLALHESGPRRIDGPGPRLVDRRATRCLALLRRPVRRLHVGSFHHVFVTVTADALRRRAVFGMVGSGACAAPDRLHARTVVTGGPTYMDALDQAVAQAGGVAWVAAENGRGQCGVGFVAPAQPRHPGQECVGLIRLEQPPTAPPARGR